MVLNTTILNILVMTMVNRRYFFKCNGCHKPCYYVVEHDMTDVDKYIKLYEQYANTIDCKSITKVFKFDYVELVL